MYFIDNIDLNKSIYEIEFSVDCDVELGIILKSKENELKKEIMKKEYQIILNEISNEKKYHVEMSIPKSDQYQIFLDGLEHYMVKDYVFKDKETKETITKLDVLNLNEIKENLKKNKSSYKFPLISNTFNHEEIFGIQKFVTSGKKLTLGNEVETFEKEFAEYIGTPYAVMVNSGSSANLLAVACVMNYLFQGKLEEGDEIIVPTLCWSTTVWPLLQYNLKPVFIDVDIETMNIDPDKIIEKITPKTKGIKLVHVMGNSCNMEKIMKIVEEYNLLLIEDTCESLGTYYDGKMVGTFGTFGTYSFYYSHHITTIEGGMVCCKRKEHYDLLRSLRAHGWTRYLDDKDQKLYKDIYPDIDNRYMFVNLGFNLRPIELNAVMGKIQLRKLKQKNENRIYNFNSIKERILHHPKNDNIFVLPREEHKSVSAWFGLCIFLNKKYKEKYNDFMKYLEDNSIENRPVITGNFTRQPYFIINNFNYNPLDFPNADYIHFNGFYIGLSCEKYKDEKIKELVEILFNFF